MYLKSIYLSSYLIDLSIYISLFLIILSVWLCVLNSGHHFFACARVSTFLHTHGCQHFATAFLQNIRNRMVHPIKKNIYPYVKVTGYLSVCLYMYKNISLTTALDWYGYLLPPKGNHPFFYILEDFDNWKTKFAQCKMV